MQKNTPVSRGMSRSVWSIRRKDISLSYLDGFNNQPIKVSYGVSGVASFFTIPLMPGQPGYLHGSITILRQPSRHHLHIGARGFIIISQPLITVFLHQAGLTNSLIISGLTLSTGADKDNVLPRDYGISIEDDGIIIANNTGNIAFPPSI